MDAHPAAVWHRTAQDERCGAVYVTFFELCVVPKHKRLPTFAGMRSQRLRDVWTNSLVNLLEQRTTGAVAWEYGPDRGDKLCFDLLQDHVIGSYLLLSFDLI